ncbi:MAG: alpha/beta fold hydrolase [Gemmatimonadetes bacterium]|nr:alpha/beta fold hydrolase [Gemmatimonadota bacterium]
MTIHAADGVRLALHHLGPGNGTPALLLAGTFSNHTFWLGTRGTGLARALAGAGFSTWALDPRGHGQSQWPRRAERWDFDDWARADLPAALASAAAEAPAFLIGHSAGGSAILAALAADPALQRAVRGVVVLATPAPWLQPWRGLLARSIRLASLLLGRFPARALGLGPEDELPGVMAQWMSWNIDGRWRGDDGADYAARLRDVRVPFLAIAGAGDRYWAPVPACRALFELLGSADKEFLLCGRDTGFAEDYGHAGLVISRGARTEVWPHILDWLRQRT